MSNLSFLLLPIFIFSLSCSSETPSSTFSEKASSWRPIAEYEKISAIFSATGVHRSAAKLPNEDPKLIQREISISNEYLGMYTKILEALPQMSYFIHVDSELHTLPNGQSYSELQEWENIWTQNKNFKAFALSQVQFPEADESQLNGDEWTRDYGPLSIRNTEDGSINLVNFGSRGRFTSEYLAKQLNIKIVQVDDFLEGGNFMATSDGVCASAWKSTSQTFEDWAEEQTEMLKSHMKCRSFIPLKSMPNESTGHIDLFAKFVSDRTVAIGAFESSDIVASSETLVGTYSCEPNQVIHKKWDDCKWKGLKLRTGPWSSDNRPIVFQSQEQVDRFIEEYYHDSLIEEKYTFPNLVEFSEYVKAEFESNGFKVAKLPSPKPVLHFSSQEFLDQNGTMVHRELNISTVYRTYLNSFIANNFIFVPQYGSVASSDENSGALQIFGELGFIPIGIDASYTISGGGATHCLTMGIPK